MVTVKVRLAIILRFLATEETYTSLQYLFKMSKDNISRLIPEVFIAIKTMLNDKNIAYSILAY